MVKHDLKANRYKNNSTDYFHVFTESQADSASDFHAQNSKSCRNYSDYDAWIPDVLVQNTESEADCKGIDAGRD